MSSGIFPTDGSVCCICWGAIVPGFNATDADGTRWDAHRGTCAVGAGITELPPFHCPRCTRLLQQWDLLDGDGFCALCHDPRLDGPSGP